VAAAQATRGRARATTERLTRWHIIWHSGGLTVLAVTPFDLGNHWWAWTVSNRRPLVCKTRALPLSYTPVPGRLHAADLQVEIRQPDCNSFNASVQTD
jgi:hypothetical protein